MKCTKAMTALVGTPHILMLLLDVTISFRTGDAEAFEINFKTKKIIIN